MTLHLHAGRYSSGPRRSGGAFDAFLNDVAGKYHKYCPGGTWTPDVNLYEDDRNFYVVADLAGVGSQAIDLEAREGKLYLTGHRPTPPPPEVHGTVHLHHMEINHGQFERVVELPPGVDVDAIEAVYRTGQLLVTLPKT